MSDGTKQLKKNKPREADEKQTMVVKNITIDIFRSRVHLHMIPCESIVKHLYYGTGIVRSGAYNTPLLRLHHQISNVRNCDLVLQIRRLPKYQEIKRSK